MVGTYSSGLLSATEGTFQMGKNGENISHTIILFYGYYYIIAWIWEIHPFFNNSISHFQTCHNEVHWKQSLLTGARRVGRICVWSVVTVTTGANTGCSWAGTAVGWTGQTEAISLFGLEGAGAASWWQQKEKWRKNSVNINLKCWQWIW